MIRNHGGRSRRNRCFLPTEERGRFREKRAVGSGTSGSRRAAPRRRSLIFLGFPSEVSLPLRSSVNLRIDEQSCGEPFSVREIRRLLLRPTNGRRWSSVRALRNGRTAQQQSRRRVRSVRNMHQSIGWETLPFFENIPAVGKFKGQKTICERICLRDQTMLCRHQNELNRPLSVPNSKHVIQKSQI